MTTLKRGPKCIPDQERKVFVKVWVKKKYLKEVLAAVKKIELEYYNLERIINEGKPDTKQSN